MRGLNIELKQFFKFKKCGILFFDSEQQKMFTISMVEEEEAQAKKKDK